MIVYHPAFDLYHCVYRILQILTHFSKDEPIEVDRLRIWDFYLLFPNKLHIIKLSKNEEDIKNILNKYIPKKDNPYELFLDNRKMFEKIKPYQLTAIKSLASYGIIKKDFLEQNKISVVSNSVLQDYVQKFEELTIREKNTISLLISHFNQIPMNGETGLKAKTNLLESKYDA